MLRWVFLIRPIWSTLNQEFMFWGKTKTPFKEFKLNWIQLEILTFSFYKECTEYFLYIYFKNTQEIKCNSVKLNLLPSSLLDLLAPNIPVCVW